MDATCPWDGFAPATIRFCEEPLCAWITQPANTWSNLAYTFVGLLIWRISRRDQQAPLQILAVATLILSVGSFLFHMTTTFFFEVLDLSGMFLISAFMIVINIQRFHAWDSKRLQWAYVGIVALSIASMFLWRPIGIPMFALHLTIAISYEILVFLRDQDIKSTRYRDLVAMIGCFSVAFFIWTMDIRKIWCDPYNNILQGHAVWHLLNAIAIFFLYKYYRQFLYKEPTEGRL